MIKNLKNWAGKIWNGYTFVAGIGLLILMVSLLYLFLQGPLNTGNVQEAIQVLSGRKEAGKDVRKVKIPEGRYAEMTRESLLKQKEKLDKRKKRLDRKERVIENRLAELEERERALDDRQQEIKTEKEEFEKEKKRWMARLEEENIQQIVSAVSEQTSRRGNPQQALSLIDQYIRANKKDEEPNYQVAYQIVKALKKEKRIQLLNVLSESDREELRNELLKRFGPVDEEKMSNQ